MSERLSILHIVHESFERVQLSLKVHQIAQRRGIAVLLPPNIPECRAPEDDDNISLLTPSELPFYTTAAALKESLETAGVDVDLMLANPSLNLDIGVTPPPAISPIDASAMMMTTTNNDNRTMESTMSSRLGTSFYNFSATISADGDCNDSMMFLAAPSDVILGREKLDAIEKDLFVYVISRALYRCRNVLPDGQVTLQACRVVAEDAFRAMDHHSDGTIAWETFTELVVEEATLQHRMSGPQGGNSSVGRGQDSISSINQYMLNSWPVVPDATVNMVHVKNSSLVLFDRLVHLSTLPFDSTPKLSTSTFGTVISVCSEIDFSQRHTILRSSTNDMRGIVDAVWLEASLPGIPPVLLICGTDMYFHGFEISHTTARSQLRKVCKIRCDSTITCLHLLSPGRLVCGDREGHCILFNTSSMLRPVSKDASSAVQLSGVGDNVTHIKLPVLHRHTAIPPDGLTSKLTVEPSVDASDAIMGACAPHQQPITGIVCVSQVTIATSSLDGSVALIDIPSWGVTRRFKAEGSGVSSMTYSGRFGVLVTSTFDSVVKVWSGLGGGEPLVLRDTANPHTRNIILSSISEDAPELLTVDGHGVAKTWDLTTGICLHSKHLLIGENLKGHCLVARSAHYQARYKRLIVLSKGLHTAVAQYVPGTAFMRAHEEGVGTIAMPQGCAGWMSVSHFDHKVWDVTTGTLKSGFRAEDDADASVSHIQYSFLDNKGARIFYATHSGNVHERRVASGQVVRTYTLYSQGFDRVTPKEEALGVVTMFENESRGELVVVCAGGTIRTFNPTRSTHPIRVVSIFSDAELQQFEKGVPAASPSHSSTYVRRQSVSAAKFVHEHQHRSSYEFEEVGSVVDPVVIAQFSVATQMVCCITLSGLIRVVRATSSSGTATHHYCIPAEITGMAMLDPYPLMVVGDANKHLTFFPLQPNLLLAAVNNDIPMVTTTATIPAPPRSQNLHSTPKRVGFNVGEQSHASISLHTKKPVVVERSSSVVSVPDYTHRRWLLRFVHAGGVPSSFGFDSKNGRLYVVDQSGSVVVYDTSRVLCAMHMIPISPKSLPSAAVLFRTVEREARAMESSSSLRHNTVDESLLQLMITSLRLQQDLYNKDGTLPALLGEAPETADSVFSHLGPHQVLTPPTEGEIRNLLKALSDGGETDSITQSHHDTAKAIVSAVYSPVDGVTQDRFVHAHLVLLCRKATTRRTQTIPSSFEVYGPKVPGTPAPPPDTIDSNCGQITALSVLPSGFVVAGYQGGVLRLWAPDFEYPLISVNRSVCFREGLIELGRSYRALIREQRGVEIEPTRLKQLKVVIHALVESVAVSARGCLPEESMRDVSAETTEKMLLNNSRSPQQHQILDDEDDSPKFCPGSPFGAVGDDEHDATFITSGGSPFCASNAPDEDAPLSESEDEKEHGRSDSDIPRHGIPTPPPPMVAAVAPPSSSPPSSSPRKVWGLHSHRSTHNGTTTPLHVLTSTPAHTLLDSTTSSRRPQLNDSHYQPPKNRAELLRSTANGSPGGRTSPPRGKLTSASALTPKKPRLSAREAPKRNILGFEL